MLAAGLAVLSTGCMSSYNRFHACDMDQSCCASPIRVPQYVYSGTQSDLRSVAIPFWTSGDAQYDGMTLMFYPIPLIDLPFSFIADTLFVPYDLYMVTLGGKTRYRTTRQMANKALHGTDESRGDTAPTVP